MYLKIMFLKYSIDMPVTILEPTQIRKLNKHT